MISDITLVTEIDHGGNIYTKETGKCYKPGIFFPFGKSQVKHLPAHQWVGFTSEAIPGVFFIESFF